MNRKNTVRTTAVSAVIAALTAVLIVLGSAFDALDLVCASAAALIIHLSFTEIDGKHAFLIYAVAAVLSFILMPMRTCSLYFAAFFGYYPLIRAAAAKHIRSKKLYYLAVFVLYNVVMTALFLLFKGIFGLSEEPPVMYAVLLISSNVFFACFELLIGRIKILYDYKIKKLFHKVRNDHDHSKRNL